MRFKLIIAFVDPESTRTVMEAAREKGATGSTVLSNARGEGIKKTKTFFGLTLEAHRDAVFFLVEEHMAREILEHIAEVGQFDDKPGTGIAMQIDVEDVLGIRHQASELSARVEEEI